MTPEDVISNELQVSPRAVGSWVPDGRGYGKPRALTENSSGLPDMSVADGSVFTRDVSSNSLRSEPDIDTIFPLPGSGPRATIAVPHAQMVNVVSPVSSEEVCIYLLYYCTHCACVCGDVCCSTINTLGTVLVVSPN